MKQIDDINISNFYSEEDILDKFDIDEVKMGDVDKGDNCVVLLLQK